MGIKQHGFGTLLGRVSGDINFGVAPISASDGEDSSLHGVIESVSVRIALGCKQQKVLNECA